METLAARRPQSDFVRGEIRFAGERVCYWTYGRNGAPWLVITHGGALNHRSFRPLAKRLAPNWRVLLWDLPGHGLSQAMPEAFTVAGCAEALGLVMDAVGLQSALHLGFSFGGVVAQMFAKAHPLRVDGLIAYACYTPHLISPAAPPEAAPAAIAGLFGDLSWTAIKDSFAIMCGLDGATQAAVKRAMAPLGKSGFLSMAQALLAACDYDPGFRIRGSWLTIAGAEDSNGTALLTAIKAYAEAYPKSACVLIPKAGHCAHMDQPEAFEDQVATWLQTIHPAPLIEDSSLHRKHPS